MLRTVWVQLESFESTLREVQFQDEPNGNLDKDLLSAVIKCYKPILDHHISSDLMIVSKLDGIASTGEQQQPFVIRSSKNVTFDSRFIEMYDEIITVMKEIERLEQRNMPTAAVIS